MSAHLVLNMQKVLAQHNLTEEFKSYTPPTHTGYVYDTSNLVQIIKNGVVNDKHSDSSFAVCCAQLKKQLQNPETDNP